MARHDAFDRLTELAAALFDAPIALITALEGDRQRFRSHRGYASDSTTLSESFCRHMVGMVPGAVMVVEDAVLDPRFVDNRLVTEEGVRFYAGAIITTADGAQDGAVCVLDTRARAAPTGAQIESLRLLAQLAAQELETQKLRRTQAEYVAMLELSEAMAGVGHWRYDLLTKTMTWSDEVYRIHGLDPGSFQPTAENVREFFHAEDLERVKGLMARARETGEGYDTQFRVYRHGDERITRVRAQVERGDGGRPVALVGVFQDVTDAVQAQDRIAQSEALFRMISETSTDIVARYEPDGRFLYVSPAAHAVLGRAPEDMLGKDCTGIIAEEDLAVIRRTLTDYVQAGPEAPSPRYEYRARKADGTPIWLEATPRAIRNADGRVVEFHDCVREVTARKAAEREQNELVETLKLAEDLAGVGCWKLDVASGRVRWSDEVYRIHGVSRQTFDPSLDDAVGYYHPDDQQAVIDWVARAIETGEGTDFRLRLLRADGEERIVMSQCRPERDDLGRTTALFGVFRDVTEQARAHERVVASEARYRLLADNATDVIATYAMDGIFTYVSPSVEGPMGYRPEELVGRPFSDFLHPEDVDRVRAAFMAYARAPEGTPSPRVPYRGVRKDGTEVWLEAHPRMIRDAAGRPVEFQDVVRDVSETKRLETELIEARDRAEAGARAKSEFLANMSHELRTPLTSVIGFSGLLQASSDLGPTERRYADRIATASEALLAVINDILDYSKLEAEAVDLEPQPFDPRATLEDAAAIVETQCRTKGLDLIVEVADDLPARLMGDAGRVRQVALNFLSNAVKFTGRGSVTLKVGAPGGRFRVEVSDTGVGMATDKIAQLFERFTQADASTTRVYGGTGLGLAISRRLIEMMGGEIGAEGRPGEGSTFWFEVPLAVADPEANPADTATDDLPPQLRVLLADDAAANRELVTAILGRMGLALDTVENGAEAVEAARRGGYDLILMDVHMPVMDGLSATRAIRSLEGVVAAVPIVALTANIQPEQVARCREAGMDAHVGKPIQLNELVGSILSATRPYAQEGRAGKAAA
ncbi:PAS domain S-box protein [Brevundimonas sp.]|uniref:PAS domain S-box protein n=1 Tax=Brevundimonas sp. TaxID=1871086 RepID=UPI00262048D1|nr:PAS domain S-box protein [Brevundimonas sp.]